jgi:hypothetical protein
MQKKTTEPKTTTCEPHKDPAYQAMVEELAKQCRCSHDQPCDGLLAGGLCDDLQWDKSEEECDHEYVKHRCVKCGNSTNEDTSDHFER